MHRLREHMRDHNSKGPAIDSGNLVKFTERFSASSDSTTAIFDLVSEAAEAMRTRQDRATQSEARAELLAEQAMEKLRFAEARIQSAETARRVAEENLQRVNERLEDAASRTRTTEAELARAAEHIKVVEARAFHAERAFSQLDQAIRAQLIGLGKSLAIRSANAT
jgi:chromosome segregation ATPase